MSPVSGPYAAAALLLVAAGLLKVLRPHDLRRALGVAGLRLPVVGVRALALLEVLVGAVAVAVGGRLPAALVALSYAAFTAFVALALRRRWPLSSCGCFGREDTPPTLVHVGVTGGFTAVAVVAALFGGPAPVHAVLVGSWVGAVYAGLVLLIAWLGYAALTVLPAAAAAARARPAAPAAGVAAFRLLEQGSGR